MAWVQQKVLPKVVKWAAEVKENSEEEDRGSLRLIRVQEYNQLYQKLKAKYGKQLVKVGMPGHRITVHFNTSFMESMNGAFCVDECLFALINTKPNFLTSVVEIIVCCYSNLIPYLVNFQMWPEKTDPLKFVYEDIAIATYLILLWQQERKEKDLVEYQSFVDLGCGNGLLVYILCGEGHTGLGIDIKKRGIWDLFSPHVQLKVLAEVECQFFTSFICVCVIFNRNVVVYSTLCLLVLPCTWYICC